MMFFKRVLLLILVINSFSFAENKFVDTIDAIKQLCKDPSNDKSTITKVEAKASVDIDLVGDVEAKGRIKKVEWNGKQRVPQNKQLEDNRDFRDCSKYLVPILLSTEQKESKLKVVKSQKTEPKENKSKVVKPKKTQPKENKSKVVKPKKTQPKENKSKVVKPKKTQPKESKSKVVKPKIWFNQDSKYVFYGQKSPYRSWKERHFVILKRKDTIPKAGDVLSAIGSVNIRKNYITLIHDKWTNAPIIGSISKGVKIKVLEVKEVYPNYFWIKFH